MSLKSHTAAILDSPPAIVGGRPALETPVRSKVFLDEEAQQDVAGLLKDGELSDWRGGPFCRRFESAFASFHNQPSAVAVNSGTSALHCAYIAAGLRAGDEVIIPAAGYVSAASAAVQQGARPIICDINSETLSLDPNDVEAHITPRTKFLVTIHLWGIPADIHGITEVARRYGLTVIEDCAQAHGTSLNNQFVGTFGPLAAYSFAPGKVISTGQGGMVLCSSEDLAEDVRCTVNKGKGSGWHDYLRLGYSYAMPEFEAIAGLSGLRQLNTAIGLRQRAVDIFQSVLADTDLRFIPIPPSAIASYFKLPIRLPQSLLPKRDYFIDALEMENVGARLTHPPMHTIPWLAEYMRNNKVSGRDTSRLENPVAESELPLVIELDTGPYTSEDDMWSSAYAVLRVYRHIHSLRD